MQILNDHIDSLQKELEFQRNVHKQDQNLLCEQGKEISQLLISLKIKTEEHDCCVEDLLGTRKHLDALISEMSEWKRKAELPMKYKRLQYNAELREQLASVTKEFDSAWNTASIYKQQRDELAEALEYILQYNEHPEVTAREALSKVGLLKETT